MWSFFAFLSLLGPSESTFKSKGMFCAGIIRSTERVMGQRLTAGADEQSGLMRLHENQVMSSFAFLSLLGPSDSVFKTKGMFCAGNIRSIERVMV